MSKDPAVLFYTSDFLSGTSFFTDAERGQYITLLCEQHQLGNIPENHMIIVCGSLDSVVIKKFVKDKEGYYYNIRMREEAIKRANYCNSRSNNKSGRKRIESCENHMNNHMSPHMENENGNRNKDINTLNSSEKNIPIMWRLDIEEYFRQEEEAYERIKKDTSFIKEQSELNPQLDIPLSIKKAHINFWSTKRGWESKNKRDDDEIDWRLTYMNSFTIPSNKAYKTFRKDKNAETNGSHGSRPPPGKYDKFKVNP